MLKELIIILCVNYAGLLISSFLHLPIPGAILGMLLMLLLLVSGVLKIEKIEKVANFFLLNMAVFFISPTMRILDLMHVLAKDFAKIIFLMMLTTFFTMGVTGKAVEIMINLFEKRKEKK